MTLLLLLRGVAVTAQLLVPSADSVDGAWTDQAGGTSLFAAIDETTASDADYVKSELAPSASSMRVKLTAGDDPQVSTGHIIRWRVGKDPTAGPQVNVTVKLYQGGGNVVGAGTLIASFTRTDVGVLTTHAETLSGAEANTISDYSDLYFEFAATQV